MRDTGPLPVPQSAGQKAPGEAGAKDRKGQDMKRTVISVLTVAALLVALSGAALATTTAIVNGTAAGDYIKGTARADTIHGRGGNDAIHGMGGNDLLYGDDGHDGLYGGPGDDTVRGGAGDDRLEERKVFGGSGNDTLYGDAGSDALYGGPGNDRVIAIGDAPGDYMDCGAGTDTVQRSFRSEHDVFVNCERFTS